jgi:cytochrome c peroxidase
MSSLRCAILAFVLAVVWWKYPSAQAPRPADLNSLKIVSVPAPTGMDLYVADARLLVVLGKALFWDMQVGSDNRTACASCHFHAGADHRSQNQLGSTPDIARTVPLNRPLTIDDFPFLKFENAGNRGSPIVRDDRFIAGSAGMPLRRFVDVSLDGTRDHTVDDGSLQAPSMSGLKIRQVTRRNTPSVINAVFNVRNFFDGRASHVFTGLTPFGDSDTAMNGLMLVGGELQPHRVRIGNASLASQAMGPPVNDIEMSYAGRTWPKIGKKMLGLVPLATQQVSPDDSVLGVIANLQGLGFRPDITYASLVQATFRRELWESPAVVGGNGRVLDPSSAPTSSDEFTQMEFNFPIFWGLAIQAYEATLISDDSRLDQHLEGRQGVLTDVELQGLEDFRGPAANCTQCHGGPELTLASFTNVAANGFDERRVDAFGFFRLGVSPIVDDIGAGGNDAFGMPFFTSSLDSTRGTFKTPGLRNVELTGPYFHTGSAATLDQVMEFYRRRGDFVDEGSIAPALLNVRVGGRGARLAAFMKALTDDRVKFERAPFDHPAICVPNGYPEAAPGVLLPDEALPGEPVARDAWLLMPAVGRGGNAVPLQTFEELLLGIGNDGSRAHAMTIPCPVPVRSIDSIRATGRPNLGRPGR